MKSGIAIRLNISVMTVYRVTKHLIHFELLQGRFRSGGPQAIKSEMSKCHSKIVKSRKWQNWLKEKQFPCPPCLNLLKTSVKKLEGAWRNFSWCNLVIWLLKSLRWAAPASCMVWTLMEMESLFLTDEKAFLVYMVFNKQSHNVL